MNRLDPTVIVRMLYRTLLLREPDDYGWQTHVNLLATTGDISTVIRSILSSQEFGQTFGRFCDEYLSVKTARILEHSQFGEVSILIREMINDSAHHRVLVDVGARGKERSNSYDLLQLCGWKGLLIEANPLLIPQINADFADLDVTIVQSAVSDYSGSGVLHVGVNDDVGSLSEDTARQWGELRDVIPVSIARLSDILRQHQIPYDFDLLSIDIEGEDVKVFNDLLNTSHYCPRWVIIEASYDYRTKSLDDLPFCNAVRCMYKIIGQTPANLLLRKL
jgi:FkbM family methyltransferase